MRVEWSIVAEPWTGGACKHVLLKKTESERPR
jgi:hypothetical protein